MNRDKKAEVVVDEVREAIIRWDVFAKEAGISSGVAKSVGKIIGG